MSERVTLKRALGLGYATLFGIGLILGAGIYVLVGKAATYVGDAIWLAVLFGTVVAFLTGLSYAELASMYPYASSTHFYVRKAWPGRELLAMIAGWLIWFEAVAGAATAALGFGEYFHRLLKTLGLELNPDVWIPTFAVLLILVMSFVNFWGIEESALIAVLFTFIEAFGLVLVVFLGFLFAKRSPNYLLITPQKGGIDPLVGVLVGAAVFYFAYTGFELQPTLSEEVKDPEINVPKAIVLALLACSALYILVSLAVVRLMEPAALMESHAPLADAARNAWEPAFYLLMAIALFSTSNTVLGFLVSSSRLSYGLASEGVLAKALAEIHPKRRTPHYSVLLSCAVAVFLIVFCDMLPDLLGVEIMIGEHRYKLIEIVAKTSSLACILAFIIVNCAVIVLRFREPTQRRAFTIPGNIGRFPVIPAIAAFLCAFFIVTAFQEWIVWLATAVVVGLGVVLYRLRPRAKS